MILGFVYRTICDLLCGANLNVGLVPACGEYKSNGQMDAPMGTFKKPCGAEASGYANSYRNERNPISLLHKILLFVFAGNKDSNV